MIRSLTASSGQEGAELETSSSSVDLMGVGELLITLDPPRLSFDQRRDGW